MIARDGTFARSKKVLSTDLHFEHTLHKDEQGWMIHVLTLSSAPISTESSPEIIELVECAETVDAPYKVVFMIPNGMHLSDTGLSEIVAVATLFTKLGGRAVICGIDSDRIHSWTGVLSHSSTLDDALRLIA